MQDCNLDKLNILYFQHTLYDLEKNHFEVLQSDEFCRDLQKYLKRLFEQGHENIITHILEKLGTCIDHENCVLRAKALGVVTEFSKLLQLQRDKDFFHSIVLLLGPG